MFTILLNLAGFYYVSIKIIEYNSLFSLVFLVLVALSVWRDGFKPAKYYLFAWSFFVLGMIIFQLVKLELFPDHFITENILQISSTATIFFMAFAMAKKINIYIEKRDEAMQLALQTSLQNEKLIARQNKLLESRVTERTKDLEQTIDTLKRQQKELGDANKFKDKIFSVISHDLKSPLSTLSGLLDLLRIKSLNEHEKDKILDNLELALENTRELLDDILSWVIKKQDTNSKHTDINVYDLVEDIFKLFNFQATSKKIEMVNKAEKDVLIFWDKNTLQTVLRNLVSNAIKFSPIYGKVEISMQTTSGEVIIKVKDNGVGIPLDVQEKILNENEYYSTRGTKNEKGTGLGLILCKEFLNKNSANISIDSFPGEGSSFIIHISTTKSISLIESSAIA
jgi:signal transduction histidine kinase